MIPTPLTTPVVLIVFNRPDLTERALQRLRSARPKQLVVVMDGPRTNVPSDVSLCARVAGLIEAIDWCHDLWLIRSDNNLGCHLRIRTGLDDVFARFERAIVLEDDVVPSGQFFRWVERQLDRYSADRRVAMVSGRNELGQWRTSGADHFFAGHPNIWGWATWADRWQQIDQHAVDRLGPGAADAVLRRHVPDDLVRGQFTWMARRADRGQLTAWDHRWQLSVALTGCVGWPPVNLIGYRGFRSDATHTTLVDHPRGTLPSGPLDDFDDVPCPHEIDVRYDRAATLLELMTCFVDPQRAAAVWRSPVIQGAMGSWWGHHQLLPFDHPAESLEALHQLRRSGATGTWLDRMEAALRRCMETVS